MDINELKLAVRGRVIFDADREHADACAGLLFNQRRPARSPRIVVRAADAGDVQAAVRFAASHGLPVSPRGSGHNFSGVAVQDGLVLDLSGLDGVRIDPARRIAEVGPGVTNRRLAQALGEQGLAFPVGHCGSVAVSGYLLGGGFGWNSGAWGIACHNVESLDVLTSDGALRRVSATEHPDIFWAARGGGPRFFGVVTAYRLRLQPLPRAMTSAVWVYPIDRVAEVEAWMVAARPMLPANVELTAIMASAPPPAPASVKVVAAVATVFADDDGEATASLATLALGAPSGAVHRDVGSPTSFDGLYDITDVSYPKGMRYAVDSFWGASAEDGFCRDLAEAVKAAPSALSSALAVVLPAKPADAPGLPDAAFSMAGATFGVAYGIWEDAAGDAANVGWLRATSDAIGDKAIGRYVGEADLDRPGRIAECYSPAAFARLETLQEQHDPAGLFRGRSIDLVGTHLSRAG